MSDHVHRDKLVYNIRKVRIVPTLVKIKSWRTKVYPLPERK